MLKVMVETERQSMLKSANFQWEITTVMNMLYYGKCTSIICYNHCCIDLRSHSKLSCLLSAVPK